MPKVVSGTGMVEFVQTGKHQTIDGGDKKRPAPPPEKTPEAKAAIAQAEAETAAEMDPKPETKEETGLEAGDEDLAERAQQRISKKHREMKQAEALANKLRAELEDSENFSKSQYQRAQAAEEEATRLKAELGELRSKTPAVEKTGLVKPDAKDPKYYDEKGQFKAFEYAEDLSGYSATKAVEDDRKRQTEERSKAEQEQAVAAFNARLEKAREKYPDWKAVVGGADTQVPLYIQQYMVESDYGGDLGYYFAKHPDETARIFKLSPIKAIAEIGKLEVQWEPKAAPPKAEEPIVPKVPSGGAPAPIKPLLGSGNAGTNVDPAKMSPKDLLAYTREKEAAKRRR